MDILVINRLKALRDTFQRVFSWNEFRDDIHNSWEEATSYGEDGQYFHLSHIESIGNPSLDIDNNIASVSFKDKGSGRTVKVSFQFYKEGEQ